MILIKSLNHPTNAFFFHKILYDQIFIYCPYILDCWPS